MSSPFDKLNDIFNELPVTMEEDEAFQSMPAELMPIEIEGMEVTMIPTTTTNNSENVEMESNKPLDAIVIYHANCADGFSAAWVFWKLQQLVPVLYNLTFHRGVYNEPPPDVEGKVVFLVDFSYKRQVVKDMIDLGGAQQVIFIDHHISAIKDLEDLGEELLQEADAADFKYSIEPFISYTNVEKSGAMLAWDYLENYFHTENYPKPLLLDYIQDRDLWKFRLARSKEVSAYVFSHEYTFGQWDELMQMDAVSMLSWSHSGAAILRKQNKDIAELLKVCETRVIIFGTEVSCANLPYIFASDAGSIMASRSENALLFSATYYDTATHRVFSLRSAESGMDVSTIAAYYGGGGHKHAAGFRIPFFDTERMPVFLYGTSN